MLDDNELRFFNDAYEEYLRYSYEIGLDCSMVSDRRTFLRGYLIRKKNQKR